MSALAQELDDHFKLTRLELLTEFVRKYKLADDDAVLERIETARVTQRKSFSPQSSVDPAIEHRRNLLAMFAQPPPNVHQQTNGRSQLREEIHEYFEAAKSCAWDTEVLKWWGTNEGSFPVLAKLARLVLSIPATSSADAVTAKRSRISPSKMSQALFVRDNYDLINKHLLS